MADGRVVIDTALENKGFVKGVQSMKGELGGLEAVAKRVGRTLALVFSAKVLFDFGKACVELGSNIAEVQNVVDVSFGELSYKIEEFAKTSIQSFGISKLSAKKTASTYMAMARGMGMAEGQASDMAIALTGLSGDVASFFNISQELADIKLKSIFTGETETLKDLGVVMTQANLKAYALSKGIDKDMEAMSQSELVALRYSFVMDQLSLAHGDFARTSDSWANQTRILSEQWKEFMSIVGQMLITVFTPLLKTLNAIVTAMIDAANATNSFIASMFGGAKTQMQQTQNQASGVGNAIEGSVGNQNELTEAVKDTNKESKKSMLIFDELNKLTDNTAEASVVPNADAGAKADGSIGGAVAEEMEKGISEKMQGLTESMKQCFDELKQWFVDFWEPFKQSWDEQGETVIASAKSALLSILGLLGDIGTAFMAVWSNGTGITILNTIYAIISDVFNIVGALAERFRIAWSANGNGVAIWQSILNIIQRVLGFVEQVAAATLDWAQGLNLEPIVSAFRGLLEAVEPFVDIVLDGLYWAYTNVLLPLAGWIIEAAVPAAVDALAAAFQVLTEAGKACAPLYEYMWKQIWIPMGKVIGEILIKALEWLRDRLLDLSKWISENPEKFQEFIIIIGSMATAFYAVTTAIKIFSAAQTLISAFGTVLATLTSPVGAVIFAVGALIAIIVLLAKNWDKVKAAAGGAWDYICGKWNAAAEWIKGNVLDPIANAFKGTINFLLGLVEGFVNFFIKGINAIIGALNTINIDIPNWVPLIGGNSFGFSISEVPELRIPRLARGAVIPPNNEFLAVLGDQKQGRNFEAPEGLLRQIVAEEVARNGGGAGEIILRLVAGQSFVRDLHLELDNESRRRGVKLVTGGVY